MVSSVTHLAPRSNLFLFDFLTLPKSWAEHIHTPLRSKVPTKHTHTQTHTLLHTFFLIMAGRRQRLLTSLFLSAGVYRLSWANYVETVREEPAFYLASLWRNGEGKTMTHPRSAQRTGWWGIKLGKMWGDEIKLERKHSS